MGFDYERDTRKGYLDKDVAAGYFADYGQSWGWKNLRFKFVAWREQKTVEALLRLVNPRVVVDIPTGTGKLASTYVKLGVSVIACDISPAMVEIAKTTFREAGCKQVEFIVSDLESAYEKTGSRADTVVCLRLMHRVPLNSWNPLLRALRDIAPSCVVSFGVDNWYESLRQKLRRLILGGPAESLCYQKLAVIETSLGEHFTIVAKRRLAPGLSREIVYLVNSNNAPEP
jgi:SAM-dependent methyltransferase